MGGVARSAGGDHSDRDVGDVPAFWELVKPLYRSREFVTDRQQNGLGIGVLTYDRGVSVESIEARHQRWLPGGDLLLASARRTKRPRVRRGKQTTSAVRARQSHLEPHRPPLRETGAVAAQALTIADAVVFFPAQRR